MENKLYENNFNINIDILKESINIKYFFNFKDKNDFNIKIDKINFVKENFNNMYKQILNTLYNWQEKNGVKFQIFNIEDETLTNIYFNNIDEIANYLKNPIISLIKNDFHKDIIYIGIDFDNCLISIEHGIGAVFKDLQLITIDIIDSKCILDNYILDLHTI